VLMYICWLDSCILCCR